MTAWLNSAIEKASNPITVNVSGLGLDVDELDVKTLSAVEFQALKSDPRMSKLSLADRQETIGLRTVFEMLKKCDSELQWGEFQKLPLQLLAELAQRITATVGNPDGDGVLGN